MVIDAHQHFWRYSPTDYPWITDQIRTLQRDFTPEDLRPLLEREKVDASIAVQAAHTDRETAWLLDLADAHPFIAGVIGWVDLQADDVEARVARVSERRKLVGIRHGVQGEPDDRFLLRPAFLRGIGRLVERGLPYDLLIYPRHLPVAADFVSRFDAGTFVLDHMAKPPIRSRAIDDWARDLRRLASAPNVWCKMSGLVTEADPQRWTPADLEPYLDVAFDAFGPGRMIMGSDWPVCTLAAEYSRTMAVWRDYLDRRHPASRDAVLGGNARGVWLHRG